ncbi:acyl-CoA carboxylase epsilon subunit [Streptomyces griseoincarnatus]
MGDPDRGALAGRGEVALRIVSGQPGEEDIAALLAVLLALRAGGAGADGQAGLHRTSPAGGGPPGAARVLPRSPRRPATITDRMVFSLPRTPVTMVGLVPHSRATRGGVHRQPSGPLSAVMRMPHRS